MTEIPALVSVRVTPFHHIRISAGQQMRAMLDDRHPGCQTAGTPGQIPTPHSPHR